MTQEEKAKAYDEALSVALETYQMQPMYRDWLEKMFPQLAESEDERVWLKKFIQEEIDCLSIDIRDCDDRIKLKNLRSSLAWLEKQGEQKAKIADFKAKDWYVSKVDGKIYNAKFMEEPLTNQKRRLEIEKAAMSATGIIEQEEWFIKGAEWSDKNPFCISSEKQGGQEPTAWSEDDEIALGDALWCCKQAASIAKDENDMGNVWYAENWLKSLKDRILSQLQSDERNRLLGKLEEWLDEYISNLADVDTATLMGSFINYLDGKLPLKPQSQWKPSDLSRISKTI